ncbi:hypothetical protein IKB17_03945 [bacterium]|nr:hypothetical protein [bacterium]
MLKIFAPKIVDRVRIPEFNDSKISQQLYQAKGVINNYLKDKHFTVDISNADDKYAIVEAKADAKKQYASIFVKNDGEIPFLRKIYSAIEKLAKDPSINDKK